jgi:PAS domain S-box-containing protein
MPRNRAIDQFLMSAPARYIVGLLLGLFAVAVRIWLMPFLGDRTPYITVFATVIFAARYLGLGPAVLTVTTSGVGIWYWFLAPPHGFIDRSEIFSLITFLLFSGVIIAFGEATRRSIAKRDEIEKALRESESRLKLGMLEMQNEIERRTAEVQQKTAETMEQARLLDLANDAIFVRTANDQISYWNEGAERLYGWSKEEALGRSTHELLRTQFPVPLSEIRKTERWQGELLHVQRDGSQITVASRWTTLRDRDGNFAGWLEINTEITLRKRAEDAARRLSGRILSLQDDERRRIARELHDSLGQYLVSLKVNLDLLSPMVTGTRETGLLSDCLNAVEECLSETRTISHLLHPPLLDEAGFASAARWYCEGFAERSRIQVDLEVPPDMARLDREVETTLFRILQEGLTNVHRHSGASRVRISLELDAEQVHLQISDDGKGIPERRLHRLREDDSATGVGLAGMRERVRELGGLFDISSSLPGTTITVSIPLLQSTEESFDSESEKDQGDGAIPGASAA